MRVRNLIFYLIMAMLLAALAETMAYSFYKWIDAGYFSAPHPSQEEFANKLEEQYKSENFDRVLGWLPFKRDIDENGARISPDGIGRPCISLYGDSFVFGEEVSHVAAWGNQLAKLLHCKVLNFGVGAYGTDQAYLRFVQNSFDPSNVVVLGVLSENIVRNVNQNRAFLYWTAIGPLKPIFWADSDGSLHLVPVPLLGVSSYDTYIKDPKQLFANEFFIPDSSNFAKQKVAFPYSINLFKIFRYKRISDGLLYYLFNTPPWYADFYDLKHPSGALKLTQYIIDHFVDVAKLVRRRRL